MVLLVFVIDRKCTLALTTSVCLLLIPTSSGLLRLRKSSLAAFRPEITAVPSSIIRELHVYGTAVAVSGRDPTKFQHQGFGMLLMEGAERIAREEHGSQKLLVISGVGTRHYYRKLGYELDGPYMSKMLV